MPKKKSKKSSNRDGNNKEVDSNCKDRKIHKGGIGFNLNRSSRKDGYQPCKKRNDWWLLQ